MTETQHPSELESVMDNLEALMDAVSVARQKVRDRQRRAVPRRAPRRPEPEPVDWVRDADEDIEREDLEAQDPDLDQPVDVEAGVEEPWEVTDPLPPASAEVRRRMSEMAVEGRHAEQVRAAAGPGGGALLEDPVVAHRVYRAAAEEMVDADSSAAHQAREVLEASTERELAVHDVEGEALGRELAEVQRTELSREQQATLFAQRIALVQEQQAVERAEQARRAQRTDREGTEFVSEIRLPLMLGAGGVAAVYGDEAVEAVERYVEQEFDARIENGELIVPVAGQGSDVDASVDPAVSAWRSVTAEDLLQAAKGGPEPTNLAYLSDPGAPLVGHYGEVSAWAEGGKIRPTEDGLVLVAGIASSDVPPVAWEQLVAEFGEPEEGVLYVPISADPHADPIAEIDAAREYLPGSLFAKNEEYERQLLVREAAAAAASDPAVWVEPSAEGSYVDLVEKQRADGGIEAMVWVDEQQKPTTHPEGVPSTWYNEDGSLSAFGHYEDGQPAGTWAWTDREAGTFVSDRAEMTADGPVSGTQQHRESPEDGWTTVDGGPDTGSSTATGGSESAEPGEVGLDAAPSTSEPSPSPGPRHDPAMPPMPDPATPSRGPRLH